MTLLDIKKSMETLMPLLRKKGVQEVFVFGSFAKGTEKKGSDLDFLVSFGEESPSLFTLAEIQSVLSHHFSVPVDLGTVKMLRPDIKDKVLSEALSVA